MTNHPRNIISVNIWNNCEVSVVEKVAEFKDLDGGGERRKQKAVNIKLTTFSLLY